jgi:hypothetical protein
MGEREGKRQLGRPKRKCVITKWVLKKQSVDWIHLAQDRDKWRAVVSTVIEPSVSIKYEEFLEYLRNY